MKEREETYKKFIKFEDDLSKKIKDPDEAMEFINTTSYAHYAFYKYNELLDELEIIYGHDLKKNLDDNILDLYRLKNVSKENICKIDINKDKVLDCAIKTLIFIKKQIVDLSGEY